MATGQPLEPLVGPRGQDDAERLTLADAIRVSTSGTVVIPGRPWHLSVVVIDSNRQQVLLSVSTLVRAAITSDNKTIVAGSVDGRVRVFTAKGRSDDEYADGDFSKEPVVEVTPHAGSVSALEFSADNRLLATGGVDGLVTVFDMSSPLDPKLRFRFKGHSQTVKTLRFDEGDGRLISSSGGGETRVWNLALRRENVALNTAESCWGVHITPDGRLLATASLGGCEIWNLDPLFRTQ